MLHTAFMLSVRGTPQLYSGEEVAMEGAEDPDNRRDFPGGFPGDTLNAFQEDGQPQNAKRMWQWVHDWLKLRREHSALRNGRLTDLFYDADTYAFARQVKNETVIIAINRSSDIKSMTLPLSAIGVRDGSQLIPLIGTQTGGTVFNRTATVVVPGRMVVAYRAN